MHSLGVLFFVCVFCQQSSLSYAALPDTISITCGHIITILPDVVVCSSAHDKLVNEVPTELANTIEATKCDPSGDNYSIEIIADQGRSGRMQWIESMN